MDNEDRWIEVIISFHICIPSSLFCVQNLDKESCTHIKVMQNLIHSFRSMRQSNNISIKRSINQQTLIIKVKIKPEVCDRVANQMISFDLKIKNQKSVDTMKVTTDK